MAEIDLSKYDKDELKKLQREVNKAVESYDEKRRADALADVEAAAAKHGFSLAELTGAKPKGGKTANPPKFREIGGNRTWTGRGRQPQWVKDALAKGKSMDDMAI
ncbi:MAG: H-NS histone family protein [Shimia sp.]